MVATPHATYLVGCLEDSDEVRLLLASQDREEAAPGPCSVESAVSSSCLCPCLLPEGPSFKGRGKPGEDQMFKQRLNFTNC